MFVGNKPVLTLSYISCFFLQAHIEECDKFPEPCPNKCGDLISREMVRISLLACIDHIPLIYITFTVASSSGICRLCSV